MDLKNAIVAKRRAPKPGERVEAVVVRGDADIAVQQISELFPVPGITRLDSLPAQRQQVVLHGATVFAQSTRHEAMAAWVNFLRLPPAHKVPCDKHLDPA